MKSLLAVSLLTLSLSSIADSGLRTGELFPDLSPLIEKSSVAADLSRAEHEAIANYLSQKGITIDQFEAIVDEKEVTVYEQIAQIENDEDAVVAKKETKVYFRTIRNFIRTLKVIFIDKNI